MPLTKVIALPTTYAPDGPQPGPDGLYRETVIEIPLLDILGRRQFAATDDQGRNLPGVGEPTILVASSAENIERVRRKLWARVYAWQDRQRPVALLP